MRKQTEKGFRRLLLIFIVFLLSYYKKLKQNNTIKARRVGDVSSILSHDLKCALVQFHLN